MNPDWARSIRDQCLTAGVPFFFKQWGEWGPSENWRHDEAIPSRTVHYLDGDNDDNRAMWRVGKKAAGRKLDGVLHDAMPAPAEP
jgi:protein gp37